MTTATLDQLSNAITEMDGMAQGALNEIGVIADLALASMKTPDAYRNPEIFATVLSAIWSKAFDAKNCINSMAEDVGCNYINEERRSRWDAKRLAKLAIESEGA